MSDRSEYADNMRNMVVFSIIGMYCSVFVVFLFRFFFFFFFFFFFVFFFSFLKDVGTHFKCFIDALLMNTTTYIFVGQ